MIAEMPPKSLKTGSNSEAQEVKKSPAADPLGEAGHDLDPAKFVSFPDSPYQLYQPFAPAGDQPQAIDALVEGIEDGLTFQTLLGVTGSGKTFTMANVIARTGRPAIIFAPNKTLAAQLYSEFREFFPRNAVSTSSVITIITSLRPMFLSVTSSLKKILLSMSTLSRCACLLRRVCWSGVTSLSLQPSLQSTVLVILVTITAW